MARLDFANSTSLDDARLEALCAEGLAGWAVGTITLRVRHSRGADFSGSAYYGDHRVFVNIGRHVRFPYAMGTHVAKTRTVGRAWHKPIYTVELADAYQLVVFVFMHELYHLLVRRARRNIRQKESMCDRFATRFLVERFGAEVTDPNGRPVARQLWDFQDLDGFVAAARDKRVRRAGVRPAALKPRAKANDQLLLFPAV